MNRPTLHHVALHDCAPQAWRNGGGLTRELLAWPTPTAWQLRVSVARIERDGPFSPFPGLQRCFAVLHGRGVRLALPQGTLTLTSDDEALAFDGQAAPMCHLIDGPTDDLNLMAPHTAGHARMQRAAPGSSLTGAHRWRGLWASEDAVLDRAGRSEPVAAHTLLWSDSADASPWTLRRGGVAFWLSLET